MTTAQDPHDFAEWTVLEVNGFRRLAGWLTEQQVAGHWFLRLDIPGADGQPGSTQLYPPTSVFAIHPTTEQVARHVAGLSRPAPVQRWELPAAEESEPEDFPDDDTDGDDWGSGA